MNLQKKSQVRHLGQDLAAEADILTPSLVPPHSGPFSMSFLSVTHQLLFLCLFPSMESSTPGFRGSNLSKRGGTGLGAGFNSGPATNVGTHC